MTSGTPAANAPSVVPEPPWQTTTLAAQPYGPLLLLVVALGFVAFGLYTFAEAWARRI